MIIRPGLCSVTFRALDPFQVIDLAVTSGIQAIEWGGDVHVPPGDTDQAQKVAAACRDAGVAACSYGSYIRAGEPDVRAQFAPVLESARALGAGNIRVWAGQAPRAKAGEAAFAQAVGDLAFMADMAGAFGVTVSVEYHRNSLTEEAEDTLALLEAVDAPNLFTYWQPVPGRGLERWSAELALLQPHLSDVHVFHWIMTADGQQRRPLAEGRDDWHGIMAAWKPAADWPHAPTAFLEFVRDDTVAQFQDDIHSLHALCGPRLDQNEHKLSMGG